MPTIEYSVSSRHPLRRLASSFSYKVRKNIFNVFMEVMPITSQTKVLDVGVTPDQSLPEFNFFEQWYPYKNQITATSFEDASNLEEQYSGLRFIQTSQTGLPFEDNAFDIVFCSAVVEHVGDSHQQRLFIAELLRVAPHFFITTPNRSFPMEFHTFLPFFHWLPQPVYQAILRRIGLTFWAKTENLNLLTIRSFLKLFPAEVQLSVYRQRLFGMTSNLVIYGKKESPR